MMILPLVAGHCSGGGIPSCDGNRTRTVTARTSRDTATFQFLRLLCPRQDWRLRALSHPDIGDVRAPDLIWMSRITHYVASPQVVDVQQS